MLQVLFHNCKHFRSCTVESGLCTSGNAASWCSFWASNCSVSFEQHTRQHSKGLCADSLSQTQAPKKKLSNKEKKQRAKVRKAQRERGEDVSDTDEDEL